MTVTTTVPIKQHEVSPSDPNVSSVKRSKSSKLKKFFGLSSSSNSSSINKNKFANRPKEEPISMVVPKRASRRASM